MKKLKLFVFITVCWIALFFISTCAYANHLPEDKINYQVIIRQKEDNVCEAEIVSFILPSSLISIEDEAFEGTAITNVALPENVETIGDYAFANIKTLKNITIPNKTTYIGKYAFRDSANVTITGAPKGYASAWAHENGIPFNPIRSFYAFNNAVQVIDGGTNSRAERLDVGSEKTNEEKHKPTGRMAGELNAEKKETITVFHIQGRSPPMA